MVSFNVRTRITEAISSALVDEKKQKQKMCLCYADMSFSKYMAGFSIYTNLIFEIYWGNSSYANVVFSMVKADNEG